MLLIDECASEEMAMQMRFWATFQVFKEHGTISRHVLIAPSFRPWYPAAV